jgi:ABC-type transporter Mla MlaB component
MLKITLESDRQPKTIKLEGKLSGPWVQELARAWDKLTANKPGGAVTVDLSEVTFVDSAGRELLSSLVNRGAQLRAAHLMTRYIVEEIEKGSRASARAGGQDAFPVRTTTH